MAAARGKVSWADLEDSPLSGGGAQPAAAVRARWADLAEDEATSPRGAAEASCAAAARDLDDAASDCSTSAGDGDGAEPLRERDAELASDEEDAAQPAPAAVFAAAAAGRAAGRRAGRAEGRPRGPAPRVFGAAAHRQGWEGSGSSWGRSRAAWQGQESWGAWGRPDSWKDAGAPRQPRHPRRHGAAVAGGKRQCQFTIGIEEEPQFRVVRRLLGEHGRHVKRISEASGGAKLRLRGRGSGFLEGPEQQESGDPLMLCVSAPDERSYGVAVRLVREHLETVYEQHRAARPGAAELRVRLHEGPREGSC